MSARLQHALLDKQQAHKSIIQSTRINMDPLAMSNGSASLPLTAVEQLRADHACTLTMDSATANVKAVISMHMTADVVHITFRDEVFDVQTVQPRSKNTAKRTKRRIIEVSQ
jgi:hypothetical protein